MLGDSITSHNAESHALNTQSIIVWNAFIFSFSFFFNFFLVLMDPDKQLF